MVTSEIRTLTHILCPEFHFENDEGVKDFAGMGEEYPIIVITNEKIYINLTPLIDALISEYCGDASYSAAELICDVEPALMIAIKEDSDLTKYDIELNRLNPFPDDIEINFITDESEEDIEWSFEWSDDEDDGWYDD